MAAFPYKNKFCSAQLQFFFYYRMAWQMSVLEYKAALKRVLCRIDNILKVVFQGIHAYLSNHSIFPGDYIQLLYNRFY